MYCKSAICKSGQFEFDSVINWKPVHILETCLWKLKSLSKTTPKLPTLSDWHISLSSNLTVKWLESLCR